jgi:hypothetical protein
LSKIVTLTFPYESLKTNIDYPIMVKNNEVINVNPVAEPINFISNQINYKN